jgi:hypothetical protein
MSVSGLEEAMDGRPEKREGKEEEDDEDVVEVVAEEDDEGDGDDGEEEVVVKEEGEGSLSMHCLQKGHDLFVRSHLASDAIQSQQRKGQHWACPTKNESGGHNERRAKSERGK